MNDDICYGVDTFRSKVIRFVSEYQRSLWVKNGHPDYPEDRQVIDADSPVVSAVIEWEQSPCGWGESRKIKPGALSAMTK